MFSSRAALSSAASTLLLSRGATLQVGKKIISNAMTMATTANTTRGSGLEGKVAVVTASTEG